MKKISLIIAVVALSSFSFVHASENPEKISKQVLQSFDRQFNPEGTVKWETNGDYFTAYFVSQQHRVMAVYDANGQYKGSAKNILYTELPTAISLSLDKNAANSSVYNILECNNDEGTYYMMTVEKNGDSHRVRYNANGEQQLN